MLLELRLFSLLDLLLDASQRLGCYSLKDWISCLLFGKGLERSRRSQKIAKATLLISTIPVRSKCSGGLRKLRRNRNRFLSVPECS